MRLEERDVLAGLEGRSSVPVQGLRLCRSIRDRDVGFCILFGFISSTLSD